MKALLRHSLVQSKVFRFTFCHFFSVLSPDMAALWAGKIGLPSPFIISSFMLEYIRLVTWGAEICLVIFVVRGKTILKASREINVLHQSSYLTPATCSTYLLVTPYIVVVVTRGKNTLYVRGPLLSWSYCPPCNNTNCGAPQQNS